MERRDFVRMLGIAPAALAASWHLDFARDRLVSQIESDGGQPLPDQSVIYRSLCTECPVGCGLRVKVRRGHPIKLEGDPEGFPGSGGLCLRGQAALARLYHPARIRRPLLRRSDDQLAEVSWAEALDRVETALREAQRSGAASFYLAGRTTGAVSDLIDELARRQGVERLPEYELFNQGALRRAYEVLYGVPIVPRYGLAQADLLVTIGADLFESFLDPVGFAAAHAEAVGRGATWIHLEPHLSLTGCSARERHVIHAGSESALLAYLVRSLGTGPLLPEVLRPIADLTPHDVAARTGLTEEQITTLRDALERKRGRVLTISGGLATAQSDGALVAVLTGLLQIATGQIGRTVDLSAPMDLGHVGAPGALEERVAALSAQRVGVAFLARIHAFTGLPVAPALLERATLRVGLSDILYPAHATCDVILPVSHGLESWVDSRSVSGAPARHRPVFKRLFDTRAEGEILLALLGESVTMEDYLATHATPERASGDGAPMLRVVTTAAFLAANERTAAAPEPAAEAGPTLVLPASLRTYDGRSRPLTLLHEIPDPVSTVSYGDAALVAETDADHWGVKDGEVLEIRTPHGTLRLPARRQPAQPAGVVTVSIDVIGAGADTALALPVVAGTGELVRCVRGVEIRPTGEQAPLAILSASMDARGKGILPGDAPHHGGHPAHGSAAAGAGHDGEDHVITLFQPNPRTSDYRWAMAIDLDKCTGCSACVAACYVENNIPIVGRAEHQKGREMSWLRIQPYVNPAGALEFVPLMCQHCDYAPCETVCPVFATYHNPEGLNAQVYNRCVGTRYCANNCPYKARRFNWFSFKREEPLDLMLNPEVSVRPKGVMEKCTFCVQRIRAAKDGARDEQRDLRDGDILPACAESCPTRAITFGNLLDPASRVRALARSKRAYQVLADLGTGPAVYYLSEDQGHES